MRRLLLLLLVLLVLSGIGILMTKSRQAGRMAAAEGDGAVAIAPRGTGSDRARAPAAARVRDRQDAAALFRGCPNQPVTADDLFRELAELHAQDPELFRMRVREALSGPYELAIEEAALQAWYHLQKADRLAPFRQLLLDDRAENHEVDPELRERAVAFLAQVARSDRESCGLLADLLETHPREAPLREKAWPAVLRWGRLGEIHRTLPSLYAENDLDCIEAAAKALRVTSTSGTKAILRELSRSHPRAEARARFRRRLDMPW